MKSQPSQTEFISAEVDYERGVNCVVMPCCGFTYDAVHALEDGSYACPLCDRKDAERASRVEQRLRTLTEQVADLVESWEAGELNDAGSTFRRCQKLLAGESWT